MKEHARVNKRTSLLLKMFIAASMVLTLTLSGCGQNDPQTDALFGSAQTEQTEQSDATEPTGQADATAQASTDKNVLRVSYCYDFTYVDSAAVKYKMRHPGVEIIVTGYSNNYQKYVSQVSTALMAGTADDIFEVHGVNYKDPATVSLLSDFYPLMNADPDFNEGDHFTNVYKALEYKGGLYTFPASFAYQMMAVNNRVSDKLVSDFARYDHVTMFDLINIYKNAGMGPGYYVNNSFDVITAFLRVMDSFVDMESRTCDFNNQRFIDFLNDVKNATEPEKKLGWSYGVYTYIAEEEAEKSKKYLLPQFSDSDYLYFLAFEESSRFENPLPLTNEKGELIIEPLKSFCISEQSENKELAWDFIKFMVDESDASKTGNGDQMFLPSTPVNKQLFELGRRMDLKIDAAANGYLGQLGWHVKGDVDVQIQDTIEKARELNNMPMYDGSAMSIMLYNIITEPLEQFNNGTMTAEQVAAEFQNKISLLLKE